MSCRLLIPRITPAKPEVINHKPNNVMFYSISYFREDRTFAYVDTRTFQKVSHALIRAGCHLEAHATEIRSAAIIYQGKNVQKVVRSVAVRNIEPKFT